MIKAYLIKGYDYEGTIMDRAYVKFEDAEARKEHLHSLCHDVPRQDDFVVRGEFQSLAYNAALDKFCEDNDYPRNIAMGGVTMFFLDVIEVHGVE